MARKSLSTKGLPDDALDAIKKIGADIRFARIRRDMTMEDLASRMFVTRKTLARLEAGDSAVSLGVLASAVHCLQMGNALRDVAAPEKDEVGTWREKMRGADRKRVRPKTDPALDF